MHRPRVSLKFLLLITALVCYLLVTSPYWWRLVRIQYREYRIQALRQELSQEHRAALQQELDQWYADRTVNPESGK
jgi:hypothetical protein